VQSGFAKKIATRKETNLEREQLREREREREREKEREREILIISSLNYLFILQSLYVLTVYFSQLEIFLHQ